MTLLEGIRDRIREIRVTDFREVMQRDDVMSISRRYFTSNGFDGTLTSIGVAIGSYLGGVETGLVAFKIGLGGVVGLATSGVWSVWEIEKAEKLAELHETEQAMLKDLSQTEIREQMDEARIVNAVASGLGPVLAATSTISPFLLEGVFYDMFTATALAVLMGVGVLFALGAYMGTISRRTWYIAGARMGLAGLVVAALNIMLPG